MTNTEKIYDWCDRREAEHNAPFGLIVYRTKRPSEMTGIWFAGVREYRLRKLPHDPYIDAQWRCTEDSIDGYGSTPEEAIAKLVEALGL